ncbi:hypothetical protein [Vibrio crassostreae]|uniref:hypothetical protein n=1 Tax=Vibrio crassostreae TaxID=246167 RepID=UPI001B3100E5|nr:hypothetical protein [Vibrio crassostreae]
MDATIVALSQHLIENKNKQPIKANYVFEELFIHSLPIETLKKVYEYLVMVGKLEDTELPLAIMTYIAIGEEFGAKLEEAFPQHKGANPKYSFECPPKDE